MITLRTYKISGRWPFILKQVKVWLSISNDFGIQRSAMILLRRWMIYRLPPNVMHE